MLLGAAIVAYFYYPIITQYVLLGTAIVAYLYYPIIIVVAQYVLLGADEGLFSLLVVSNNPDPVMEQVRTS